MPDTSDLLRTAQANMLVHARRTMRFTVLTGFLLTAIAIVAIVSNPHTWWLAAVCGTSLALNAHSVTKTRHLLALTEASEVRWWMRPVAYANGAGGASVLAWALWQLAKSVGAT